MTFVFQKWQAGERPPKGFDVADCIDVGWTRDEVTAMLKATVCDELPDFPQIKDATMRAEFPANGEAMADDDHDQFDAPPGPTPPTNRAEIRFIDAELPRIVDMACQALVDAEVEIFARGTVLVRPISLASAGQQKGVSRRQGATILAPVDETSLVEILTSNINWFKYDSRLKDDPWKPTSAPIVVAKTILARRGDWPFFQLTAVVTAPTLRHDWSILAEPGFDKQSGVYFSPAGVKWPALPDKPTKQNAIRALSDFTDLLSGFPFVSAADLSGALGMILTALVRPSLPTAPLFGVSAPVPGSGKSKIIDIAAMLATGRNAPVMSAPREEAELQKSIAAALMAGDGFLSIDNIEHPLRSEFLCQCLTQQTVKSRVLGQSLNLDLPTAATVCATGNALRFAGDLTRRVVQINLDPGMERPEERIFERDALADAAQERVRLVLSGLTIIRAFILSGAPAVRPALGSFEVWSNVIRSALIWLGAADPLANADRVRDGDPERERTSAIIHSLPRGRWTVAEVAEMLRSDAATHSAGREHTSMAEAMGEFIGYGDKLDVQGFGKFLRKHQDRIVDGMRIVNDGKRHKVVLWKVERLNADTEETIDF